MKQDLARTEKIKLLKQLSEELQNRQLQRMPLEPHEPVPPPDVKHQELSLGLQQKADAVLSETNRGDERVAQAVKLLTASLKAHPTNIVALEKRAALYLDLNMWKEAEDDATYAEELLRNLDEHTPLNDEYHTLLVNSMYHSACARIQQGYFEDAHRDLHYIEREAPTDSRVKDTLERVHAILDDYKERFGEDIKAQLPERLTKFKSYGLVPYDLILLVEAGIPAWYVMAKVAIKMVNEIKVKVDGKKSREHHELLQCHNCWIAKSDGASLSQCGKCKTAFYCSRECQQKHWPAHKTHCKNASAARNAFDFGERKTHPLDLAANMPPPKDVMEALQSWTAKHRPVLAHSLVQALNLRADPKAHLTKTMIVMVQWMPGKQSSATQFKAIAADVRDIASLGAEGQGVLDTRANLDSEYRKTGGFGVAMMIISCISYSHNMMNMGPVYLPKGVTLERVDPDWNDKLIAKVG